MSQIEYLPLILTGLGLTASILYYTMILRNANKTQQLQLESRNAQLFNHLSDNIWSRETQDAINILYDFKYSDEEFEKRYKEDFPFHRAFVRWAYIFERIGTLIKSGVLAPSVYVSSYSTIMTLINDWEKFRNVIYKFRESGEMGKYAYNMWEYAYDETIKYLTDHPELYPELKINKGTKTQTQNQ